MRRASRARGADTYAEPHPIPNGAGWTLDLCRYADPRLQDRRRRPLLIVPGYGMNAYVLGDHPEGPSLIEHLVLDGFEVWTANLRGQGGSIREGRARPFGLRELVREDLPRALAAVRAYTRSEARLVDVVGCSLGGTYWFAYLALHGASAIGSVAGLGAPLVWLDTHPLMRVAFASPRLAGGLPFRGTRALARFALPVARHVPGLLSPSRNTRNIDLSDAWRLTRTVDDPVPRLNRDIAEWMRTKDLHLDGVNITEAVSRIERPALFIYGNADGIVSPAAARSAAAAFGVDDVMSLEVGDAVTWYAHADLFIGREAGRRVFAPLSEWLSRRV